MADRRSGLQPGVGTPPAAPVTHTSCFSHPSAPRPLLAAAPPTPAATPAAWTLARSLCRCLYKGMPGTISWWRPGTPPTCQR